MKAVIIGGVAAGASAAARLRRMDENAEIIIFERGGYISYANCGLPYHIGEVIAERDALLLQTPEKMKAMFNIDVRVNSEVTDIDRKNRTVHVKNSTDGTEYDESYDQLLVSTGSSPVVPGIPGIESDGIYTIWAVPDMDRIKAVIDRDRPKTGAVIGGGFIGVEMAENLHERGLDVHLIEAADQIMAPVDPEMAAVLHENIAANAVSLHLGDGVSSFEKLPDGRISISTTSGNKVTADIVILSIGIRPNSGLAKKLGFTLNKRGAVVVDRNLRTEDPSIWAAGDTVEVESLITGEKTMSPLAGPANKQGRIAADNIAAAFREAETGEPAEYTEYRGSLSTSISKVFDLAVASTGLNEKTLIQNGLIKNKDYYTVVINQKSHAGYYPVAVPMYLKLIFSPEGRIFGAQIVGQDGVDKRIDTISAIAGLHGTVKDLRELEAAYAPPFSSAKDPVNMAGFTAQNIIDGLARFVSPKELDERATAGDLILDIREDAERIVWAYPDSKHIPLTSLRDRIHELDEYKTKGIIIYCAVGVRSYNAARILSQNGFTDVRVLEAGTSFYRSATFDPSGFPETGGSDAIVAEERAGSSASCASDEIKILDCCGLQCPGPIMKVNSALQAMNDGETLRVSATDMGFARDIESWCGRTGNTYLGAERRGKENIVTLRKGTGSAAASASPARTAEVPAAAPAANGKTMIVFDGDMDKAMAAFIIANGAAAMGRPVTMFFTFWGLNVLRKKEKVSVKKSGIEKMFGAMMPRGTGKLKISKMNMGGMGTKMMKKVMAQKNVLSLDELMRSAMDNGVRIIACTMSMDVMGIREEELIDGVEFAGVASYLGDAEMSNVNLFI